MITPWPPTTINTGQQRRYPLPRHIRQLTTTTHHKINYQTGPRSCPQSGWRVGVFVVRRHELTDQAWVVV
ncbi:hypothetical protein, partial [Streptomyces sp. NPDC051684]|uniref:hypothetical protein n=1 Tax=Streptomyces sp. NPDC051684 TaxID=3365670 RepID=UPI003789529E